MTTTQPLPTTASVAEAAENVAPHVRRTPVLRAQVDGRPLVLKLEHLQRGGSFKLRGAVNALAARPLPTHVVTASGGNHGIAVATAAAALGLPATVYVPAAAPEGKTRRIEAAGARLVRHGATYGEAAVAALAQAQAPGVRYVPAYDDPAVVAGQGTCTAEAVADAPEVDAVVVAAGGGGLSAGAALASGGRTVVVVEPEGCCCVHRALAAGRPVESASSPSRPRRWARPGWARCRSPSCRRRRGVGARDGRRAARRAGPAVGGVPAGRRAGRGGAVRRVAGRAGPGRARLPGALRRQHRVMGVERACELTIQHSNAANAADERHRGGHMSRPFDAVEIVFNPNSTGDAQERADELAEQLAERAPELPVTLRPTERAGHGREIARDAARGGRPLVVSVSGDGGYDDSMNGLMEAGGGRRLRRGAGGGRRQRPPAALPAGRPLADAIVDGDVSRLDLLKFAVDDPPEVRYAHSYIGLGVARTVALELEKGGKGSIKEVISTIRTFSGVSGISRSRPTPARESFDSVIFADVREMAKFEVLGEEGEPDDGEFEVMILRHAAKWRVLSTAVRAAISGPGPATQPAHECPGSGPSTRCRCRSTARCRSLSADLSVTVGDRAERPCRPSSRARNGANAALGKSDLPNAALGHSGRPPYSGSSAIAAIAARRSSHCRAIVVLHHAAPVSASGRTSWRTSRPCRWARVRPTVVEDREVLDHGLPLDGQVARQRRPPAPPRPRRAG